MQQRLRSMPRALGLFVSLSLSLPSVAADGRIDMACVSHASAINPQWLEQSKQAIHDGDTIREAALLAVIEQADRAFTRIPAAISDKSILPPSGDPQDYMSLSPYWWPDPKQEDGLPWTRQDGRANPLAYAEDSDKARLRTVVDSLEVLTLAWTLTGDLRYARKATQLLELWFIDPDTRMNPHLKYAQSIPGRVEGRSFGIIDARAFTRVIDSLALIDCAKILTQRQSRAIKQWYREMLDWLINSDFGKTERAAQNNHGTHYDAITLSIALYLDDLKLAKETASRSQQRLLTQVTRRGEQPHELDRTRPFHYSVFNLEAFFRIAAQAELVGIDLWRYPSKDDARLKQALDYLLLRQSSGQWQSDNEKHAPLWYLDSFVRRAAMIYPADSMVAKLNLSEQTKTLLNCALLHPPASDVAMSLPMTVPDAIHYQRCGY